MDKSEFEDYERRVRLYHNAFEEYDSLKTTYTQFYTASSSLKRRGHVLAYGSTIFGAILLYLVGTVAIGSDSSSWQTDFALGISILVTAFSFYNAVDSPQQKSNVTYNSGQILQRVYLEFHYFVTVELPDPDEDLDELEKKYERLLERKNTVNETTPQLGNKWYFRTKEQRDEWRPIPLTEITGEEDEFEVQKSDSGTDEQKGRLSRLLRIPRTLYVKLARWLGF